MRNPRSTGQHADAMLASRRGYSSLAQKLREAASSETSRASSASPSSTDYAEKGDSHNELFVMPKRKLLAQLQLERITGRSQMEVRSRMDIQDRLAVRRPREEEMRTDQDWTAVWPAARSFASSVVPLPVRMGTRKNPEKRAPFKKQGNLELVKIPNFLHLTPPAIEKHCAAIKKFCTEFPEELKGQRDIPALPLVIKYADYVHQGTNIRDNRARVTTMQLKVSALGLSPSAMDKMRRLAGKRYDEETDTLTLTTDRCFTRAQNYDYAFYLLTVLYHEANKVEKWEAMKEREDNLRIAFEGSTCERRLEKAVEALKKESAPADLEQKKKEFTTLWDGYLNTEETAESTRAYAAAIKKLLLSHQPPPVEQQQTAQ